MTLPVQPLHPPSADDRIVAGASEVIGGPLGRHAVGRLWSWATALRIVLILVALVCGGAYARTSVCSLHYPVYSSNYQYTRLCYSDVYALYGGEDLGTGPGGNSIAVPYRDHAVEYPPIMGYLMLGAAEVTHLLRPTTPVLAANENDPRPQTFFDITALILAFSALLATWALAKVAGAQRTWDAAMFGLSPVLLMHAYTNWDLAAIGFTMLGVYAWSRRHPVVAGALIGLGISTKLFPLLVLVAIVMLCLRAGRLKDGVLAIAGTIGAVVVAYLPAIIISKDFVVSPQNCSRVSIPGWEFFSYLSKTRGADWGSFWLLLQHVLVRLHVSSNPLDYGQACGSPTALNVASFGVIIACAAGVMLLVIGVRQRPRLGQVAFLLIAAFIVFNKVDSPQYALWLLPFAILARPKWGGLLAWQLSEVVLGAANLYTLIASSQPGFGLPLWTYLVFLVVRDLVLAWLAYMVIREMIDPSRDVVRADGTDDPAGGVLDHAPDGGFGQWDAHAPDWNEWSDPEPSGVLG